MTFDPGPLADVHVHADGPRRTLVFVRDFRHAPDKVWAALTSKAQLPKWAPFAPDRDMTSEGDVTLRMLGVEPAPESRATILRAEPPSLLEYTWDGDRLVWELTPNGTGTRLTLRHTVDSMAWVPKVAAGWHLCFAAADALLDGRPMESVVGPHAKKFGWDELHDRYAAALGVTIDDEDAAHD